MPNIVEVAELAGVSISTVSHVINGTKYVSEDLKKKVLNAIKETNYQADDMASSMKRRQTRNIGVILPRITMVFFPDVLEGIDIAAKERGYRLFYFSTDYDFEKEIECIEMLKASWVDGIVLDSCCTISDMPRHVENLTKVSQKKNVPVVTLEFSFNSPDIGAVTIDHRKYTTIAINHLIELGHKKIAMLGGPVDFPLCVDNLTSYKGALVKAGLEFNQKYVLMGDYLPASGYNAVNNALKEGIEWTALFAANDQMGIGAMRALKEAGIDIPHDVAVMGADNVFPSTLTSPALTTIDVPKFRMGYEAVRMLVDRMQGKEVKQNEIVLDGKLVVRESTCTNAHCDWNLFGW